MHALQLGNLPSPSAYKKRTNKQINKQTYKMENGSEENTYCYSLARSRTGPDGPELLQ